MNIGRRHVTFSLFAMLVALGGGSLIGGVVPHNAIAATTGGKKVLVIYFSWSGNTKTIATQIQQTAGGDIVALELVKPYSANSNTCRDEAKRESAQNARPELK